MWCISGIALIEYLTISINSNLVHTNLKWEINCALQPKYDILIIPVKTCVCVCGRVSGRRTTSVSRRQSAVLSLTNNTGGGGRIDHTRKGGFNCEPLCNVETLSPGEFSYKSYQRCQRNTKLCPKSDDGTMGTFPEHNPPDKLKFTEPLEKTTTA